MRTASFLLLAAAPAMAFVPASVPQQRSTVRMAAENNVQGAVAKGLATAGMLFSFAGPLAGVSTPAIASSGDSPKISIFGLGGDAASSPFVEDTTTYSPYSPYGTGSDALFKSLNDDDIKFYKGKVSESVKRLGKIQGYLDEAKWFEVRAELNRQMYDFRRSALKLAQAKGTPAAKAAAEKVFRDIEVLDVAAGRKQLDVASSSYKAALADVDAFLKSI